MNRDDIIKQMERAGLGEGSKIPQTWNEAVDAFTRFALADTDKYWPDDKDPLGQLSARKKYEELTKEYMLTWVGMGLDIPRLKDTFLAELPSLLQRIGASREELDTLRTKHWDSLHGKAAQWKARDKLDVARAQRDQAFCLLKQALTTMERSFDTDAPALMADIRKVLGEGQ